MIQTIYTRGICIYTSSSQEIFLPQVHGPIPQVKCNYTNKLQICSRYGKRATTAIPRVKLVYTRGRKLKNRLRLRTQAETLRGYQVLKKNILFETLGILESSVNAFSVSTKYGETPAHRINHYEEFSSEKG